MSENSNNADSKNEGKKDEWTPEKVENIIKLIDSLGEKYIKYKVADSEAKTKRLVMISHHNRRLTYSLLMFLGALVLIMSYLTWLGRVGGDALLFLAGTITGYIIFLVRNLILQPMEEPEPEEE